MHKALGRGLESLLPSSVVVNNIEGEKVVSISIDKVKPNRYQPRTNFNETKLRELSDSIKEHGLAQPLLVTPSAVPGDFELIAGERRLRACRLAGLKEIAVIIRKVNDKERLQLSIIENIQREDLNAIEEARAYKRLSEEFNLIQEDLARILGKDRSVVANTLRLLNLPKEIQEAIAGGIISSGHGRILAGVEQHDKQKQLADKIVNEKLTVREIENIVANWKSGNMPTSKKVKKQDVEITKLAEDLQHKYGTKVKIAGRIQKGRIEIYYYSLKELERIAKILKNKK